ncbi:MAG TPA: hypothetical protein PKD45_01745 [Flavobacteriales bacterium]|nr:hypothetical protein [Flavobacteriales bacterium]
MSRVVQLVVIGCLLGALMGCGEYYDAESFAGIYTPTSFVNSYDTIMFEPDGTYQRTVHDSLGNMVKTYIGSWTIRGGHEISIGYFFLNLDYDLARYPEAAMDSSMHITMQIRDINGNTGFCVGYLPGEYCYKRITRATSTRRPE